jgi:hypothetical protein
MWDAVSTDGARTPTRTPRGRSLSCRHCWTNGSSRWQNRPHDGLRHRLTPGKAMTPNEQYAALVEIAGYVPVSLSSDDYIELLPMPWRVINSYGIQINHRRYDAKVLTPYRRQDSGVTAQNGRWEVHHDPYDVTRIWVRNHHDGGWITVPWTHLHSAPVPFGERPGRRPSRSSLLTVTANTTRPRPTSPPR